MFFFLYLFFSTLSLVYVFLLEYFMCSFSLCVHACVELRGQRPGVFFTYFSTLCFQEESFTGLLND